MLALQVSPPGRGPGRGGGGGREGVPGGAHRSLRAWPCGARSEAAAADATPAGRGGGRGKPSDRGDTPGSRRAGAARGGGDPARAACHPERRAGAGAWARLLAGAQLRGPRSPALSAERDGASPRREEPGCGAPASSTALPFTEGVCGG